MERLTGLGLVHCDYNEFNLLVSFSEGPEPCSMQPILALQSYPLMSRTGTSAGQYPWCERGETFTCLVCPCQFICQGKASASASITQI